VIVRLHMNGYF